MSNQSLSAQPPISPPHAMRNATSRLLPSRVPVVLGEALAVVFPTACSGCGKLDVSLCAACRLALHPRVRSVERDGFTAWAALEYAGTNRSVIAAYKDGGRTDAAPALAAALRHSIGAALQHGVKAADGPASVHLVTIPSSTAAWRIRGYHPVNLLVARCGLRPLAVLEGVGEAVDQVGLTREQRATNKHGSMRSRRQLNGQKFLLVDDIVTTGASVREATRALSAAGGTVIGVAALAETPRRFGGNSGSQETDR